MNDDDWARGVIADAELGPEPPSKVDALLAVRRGRRRLWVRRTTVAFAATGAAVTAAAGSPLMVPGNGTTLENVPLITTFTQAPVSPTPDTPAMAPTRCDLEPLELPAGMSAASIHGADPSGRYAVGLAYRTGGGDMMIGPGGDRPVLWDNGKPAVLEPPRAGLLQAIHVNSSGFVAMAVKTESATFNWTYRAGAYTELSNPDGNYTAMGINTRGDVAGAWLAEAGVHLPVVWPAGEPGKPRELRGGDTGDENTALVGGIDDDGTVVGVITSRRTQSSSDRVSPPENPVSRPVFWPADGGLVRTLPTPAGFGPNGWVSDVRSGIAVGRVSRPDPDLDRRGDRAAIWDLSKGTVRLDDRLGVAQDVNAHGWFVGRSSQEPPAPSVAVFAGAVVTLPMLVAPDSGGGVSISDDGRTIHGSARINDRMTPVRWTCT